MPKAVFKVRPPDGNVKVTRGQDAQVTLQLSRLFPFEGPVSVEVTSAPNPRVFALLKAGPSLTIEVAGTKETIPLAGATPHVAPFEKLCFGRR